MSDVKIIAAVGDNRLLGVVRNGVHALPWHIPEDLKHFKEHTHGCPVLMGSTTWESLPEKFRPLPGRTNIILSRRAGFILEGAHVFNNLEEALRFAHQEGKAVWIIGGAYVYQQALPFADELVLTRIEEASLPAQTGEKVLFPEFEKDFVCTESSEPITSETGVRFKFETWKKK